MQQPVSSSAEWKVLRGQDEIGPFTDLQIIAMLQRRTLFGFDKVRCSEMTEWKPIAVLPEFSADRVHRLSHQRANSDVFIHRVRPRSICNWSGFIVQDDQKIDAVKIESISSGGALLRSDVTHLVPGDFLTLLIVNAPGLGTQFAARGEVLNKYSNSKLTDEVAPICYPFRFHFVQANAEREIEAYIEKRTQLEQIQLIAA